MLDKFAARAGKRLLVFVSHRRHAATIGIVELPTLCVEDVGLGDLFLSARLRSIDNVLGSTGAGGVVNHHTRFDVVAPTAESYPLAAILHGLRFHKHARGHKITALKHRRHSHQHVQARRFDVIAHFVFKRLHRDLVHCARTGDEVLSIRILAGEMKREQVAAVIEGPAHDEIVMGIGGLPTGGLDLADVFSLAGRHRFRPDDSHRRSASSEPIKRRILLKAVAQELLWREERHVIVDDDSR